MLRACGLAKLRGSSQRDEEGWGYALALGSSRPRPSRSQRSAGTKGCKGKGRWTPKGEKQPMTTYIEETVFFSFLKPSESAFVTEHAQITC